MSDLMSHRRTSIQTCDDQPYLSIMTSSTQTASSSSSYDPLVDTSEDWWFWPRDEDGNPIHPDEHEETRPDGGQSDPNTRADWVAHRILKTGARLLDPIALNEPPNRPIAVAMSWLFDEDPPDHDPLAVHTRNHDLEVTDPIEHVPFHISGEGFGSQEYGVRPNRWRVSEEYGHIVRGPVIADRPAEELLELVEFTLEVAGPFCDRYISDRERDDILNLAERMKRDGGAHDVTIMAEVVRCLEDPDRI